MNGRDFLSLARELVAGATEAEWRTAVSRGYYAAFHLARELFEDLGFAVPRGDRAHGYLWLRLQNCSHAPVVIAGAALNQLRADRNQADYDLHRPLSQRLATSEVQAAAGIIQALDTAKLEPIRSQITDAMKIYERDVLQDVTWHP